MMSEKGFFDNLQASEIKTFLDPNNEVWAKTLANVPVSIHIKSETNNGGAELRWKDCQDENISRCHIWYFT